MVAPSTIDIPSTGSSGADIYAATRVVSLIPGDGTDLTVAAAIAALPAEGGTIFIKQGVYPQLATNVLPDKAIRFVGAGSGFDGAPSTTLDLGALLISMFTRANKKKYRFEHMNIIGTGVVGQTFFENQVGTDEYVDVEDVIVKNIQTCFSHDSPWVVRLMQFEHRPGLAFAAQFWTFLGGAGGTSFIYADQTRVIGATIDDNPFLFATNSLFHLTNTGGPIVNNIRQLKVSACEFAGEILVQTGGSEITGCTFTNGTFGALPPRYLDFPAGVSTITGCIFNIDATAEYIRISGGTAQAQITGCVFSSAIPGTRVLNLTVPSGANIVNCDFHGGTSEQIQINATSVDVTITGCNFTDDGGGARAIDILGGSGRCAIVGNNFKFFGTEAIQIAGFRCTVVGNTGCKVVETAAANLNIYSANGGFSGSTISVIGNASLVEDNNVRDVGVDIVITDTDRTILVDASGANRTVTLAPAATDKWRKLTIKKKDATVNTVTIDADAAETIDGTLTIVLTVQYQSITIQSDGTTWWII